MKRILVLIVAATLLTGCANTEQNIGKAIGEGIVDKTVQKLENRIGNAGVAVERSLLEYIKLRWKFLTPGVLALWFLNFRKKRKAVANDIDDI